MATIQSPPNSVWPNGLQTDEEGYVNFYSLGTNKVDISTITWPEGTKVKSPFVYQNDKLVGFVDTKALEIDNNDTTIDINYAHFDADLDSIMENTLTINAPENATVNVKYGAVDKILTEKIEKVLGKGNCKVSFDKAANKAVVTVALDTTEALLADVQTLLDRVLPRNLVTEFDPFPCDFERLEFLETTGTQRIDTGIIRHDEYRARFEYAAPPAFISGNLFGWSYKHNGEIIHNRFYFFNKTYFGRFLHYCSYDCILPPTQNEKGYDGTARNVLESTNAANKVILNGEEVTLASLGHASNATNPLNAPISLLEGSPGVKVFSFTIFNDSDLADVDLIPALDPTGAPCMFDTVSRTPFYNSGTGDFLYPGAEQAVQTTDLDAKSYAKLTEHGVRRLYKVPKGYNGSMDDYAAANVFKELVEPPAPLEGYWMPVWRETETQLICDWVETEPPVEEEIINNEN